MQIKELYEIYKQCRSVQTDTRKLQEGDLFFALRGENFNGNSFARAAIEKGATRVVIDDKEFEEVGKTILVNDALETLQQLSKYHRQKFNIPFLAITGSNGKTTTKELVHAVLSSTFKTYTTEGNLNNHIGIPLTLLKIKNDAEIAVVEMGANHRGEIASYCKFAMPTHGMITNCGKAHLEGFGGVEGVIKGKGELFDYLREMKGTAFVMWDYDYLRRLSDGIPHLIKYGTHDAELTGETVQAAPFLKVKVKGSIADTVINTNLVGDYNLPNVLAAVSIGEYFRIEKTKIKEAIEAYIPSNNRSQLIQAGSNTIIMDAYNANPSSMRLAIENLMRMGGKDKVLILGAMAELGEDSLKEHRAILDLISEYHWRAVVLTGGDFLRLKHPYISFNNAADTRDWFRLQQLENTLILIKGSRSSQMEKVLEGNT